MYKIIKRIIDIAASLSLIILLAPLILTLFLLILIFIGSPVIFKQTRPGLNCHLFTLYKFRSMSNGVSNRFGRFLRFCSLDEIPSLYNILIGDMSFVGPRPLLKEYLPYYSLAEIKRHDVRPGLTGLTQVKGRNRLTWERRFELDLFYVSNVSFYLDLKILIYTFLRYFKFDGALPQPGENIIKRLDEERSIK